MQEETEAAGGDSSSQALLNYHDGAPTRTLPMTHCW